MLPEEESQPRRTVVILHRCGCRHCDFAEEQLGRLAKAHGVYLEVKRVENEGLSDLAGWKTPIVYVNGVRVTHYETNSRKWEEAIKKGVASVSQ